MSAERSRPQRPERGGRSLLRRRAELLGPLADRQFRLLWLAASTSAVGSAFVTVALAFAVLGIGGNATSLGLVLLAGTLAGLASFQVAGVWADRLSRRNLMLAADLVRMLVEVGVAVLLLTGQARIWELGVASVLLSVGYAVESTASVGLIAQIVSPERLQKANSLLSVSTSGASVAGPALSGLLVAAAGAGWAFAVDAASFAGSAAFLLAMPALGRVHEEHQRFFAELAAGWREVASRSWAWSTLIGNAFGNMAFAIFLVLGPVLALQRLGGASAWGFVSSGMAVGTLIGGFIAMWHKARRPIAFGMSACMLTALPMLALADRLSLYLVVVSGVVGMSGVLVLNTNWATAIQQVIPTEVLSRFRSYDFLLAFVAMPVGYAIAGPLESAFGADKVLYAAAAVALAANAIPATLPVVRAIVRRPDGTIIGPPNRPPQDSTAT
jgi:MFS family permease